MLKRTVIFHHPQSEGAAVFAAQVGRELDRLGVESFIASAWEQAAEAHIESAGLIICIGGDGTVLRGARVTVPHAVPILGVNMGRLGFLTDMAPRDLFNHLERVVAEDWRLEERMMARAEVHNGPSEPVLTFHALNDIVVSRRLPGRPIYVETSIDGARVATYRCDGIIVATPTGSTGYCLSAGGPILAPTEHHLVVTPVSAHMSLGASLVLEEESVVELQATSESGAYLSIDGQEDVPVSTGVKVIVHASEHKTRFVRFSPPSSFYAELAARLEVQLSSVMNRRA